MHLQQCVVFAPRRDSTQTRASHQETPTRIIVAIIIVIIIIISYHVGKTSRVASVVTGLRRIPRVLKA